ncbi:MAG TPA: Vms1/Ankzf1 family peptidyl-tRNA hydrolase [Acidimicrobiales bacterium]|nr:Vms1/Ankzf1 family peptidyl-tRNA hydrolase [Acidimicrobiales bacterium]
METTRSLPAGGVAADRLRTLAERPGPVLTVSLRFDPTQPDADRRARVAWASIREQAERLGVPALPLDALDDVVSDVGRTDDQLVAVADDAGPLFVGAADAPTGIRWQPTPWFAPVVATLQDDIDHAVVTVDRTGADIAIHRAGRDTQRTVTTDAHPIHKAGGGGWAHRRMHARVEDSWRVNASEIAATVIELVRGDGGAGVDLLLLGGDEREVGLVRQRLPHDVADTVTIIPATRAAGGDDEREVHEVDRALADAAARRTVAALELVRQRSDDGGAVEGTDAVLAALRASQVAFLLFGDEDGGDARDRGARREVPYVPGRPDLVGAPDLADEVGDAADLDGAAPVPCPVVDAAVAAAVLTGAEVRLVPRHVGEGRLHALLRWDAYRS